MNLQEKLEQAEALLNEVKEEMQRKEVKTWPQVGDLYWTYTSAGPVSCRFDDHVVDKNYFELGLAFKTKEQCGADFEARKVIYELKQQPGCERFVVGKTQWTIIVDPGECKVLLDHWTHICRLQDSVWFESIEAAQAAVEAVGKDRIIKAARWFSMGEV